MGRTTREMINAIARSRAARRSQQRGQPQRVGHHRYRRDMAMRKRGGDRGRLAGRHQHWPFSLASIPLITSAGNVDRFARVSWRTLLPSR